MEIIYAVTGFVATLAVLSACALAAGYGFGRAVRGKPVRQPRPRRGSAIRLPATVRARLSAEPPAARVVKRPPDQRRPAVRYGDAPGGATAGERAALEAALAAALGQES
jgi:hypothetical protein